MRRKEVKKPKGQGISYATVFVTEDCNCCLGFAGDDNKSLTIAKSTEYKLYSFQAKARTGKERV